MIWSTLFLAGVGFLFFSDKIENKNKSQAVILKEMSEAWLREAQMNQRVFIKDITLEKDLHNQLSSVNVTLKTDEKYKPHYRNQLLAYLNKRGKSETGYKVKFSFLN
jgi:hypothetical protein